MMDNEFPDDENGNTLRFMKELGDDLSVARTVDFSVVFNEKEHALNFVKTVRAMFDAVDLQENYEEQELKYDVTASKFMVPSYRGISELEILLEKEAISFGGYTDGWGCINIK